LEKFEVEESPGPKDGPKSDGLHQASPASNSEACSLGVNRSGAVVQISITCAHDYAAIALYEQVVAASQQGFLNLKLKARP